MTSASAAMQAATVAALRAWPGLVGRVSGIFDGPPTRAAFPYVALAETVTADWSHKSGRGRELRLSMVVWDDGRSPARLQQLMAEVELAVEELGPDLEGHRLVSLSFLRSRVVRDPIGPWAGIVQYRALLLEE